MSAYNSGVAYDLPGHDYNPNEEAARGAPRQGGQAYDVEHAYYHPDNGNMHYGANPNISDPLHPDYDPAIDPQLQLRSVRTAAESIAESHRSEARRDARRKKGRHKKGESVIHKLGRGLSLRRGLSTKKGNAGGSHHVNEKSPLAGLVADEFGGPHKGAATGAHGTGGLGVGVPFDSAQQDHTPATPAADIEPQPQAEEANAPSAGVTDLKGGKRKVAKRRQVYLNASLPRFELKKNGDPKRIYPRNKVRTSKYTPLTFLPRFLYEQFRRIANVYFLILIVLQIRPEFTAGATVPQIAMLPLVAILTITAIKDGIEDYRRHALDDEVNNSAATRLGGWRNVNQAKDPRNFLQKMLGLGGGRSPGKVTRGIRKLREQEDAIGMRNVSGKGPSAGSAPASGISLPTGSRPSTDNRPRTESVNSGPPGFRLETIVSESERLESDYGGATSMGKSGSQRNLLPPSAQLTPTSSNTGRYANDLVDGVMDYGRPTPGTARWERTLWKKLEVGDIVLLREDDQVPADIVILNTSDPDKNAYIETKNLDGETNLKVRKSLKCTSNIQSEEDIEHSRFLIDSEPPHANLYAYNGLLKYTVKGETSPYEYAKEAPPDSSAAAAQDAQSTKVEPVTINELLLRGCSLRNTDWIIGMVLFTGEDTKIMLNGGETPSKRSKIEKETNFNVMMNFVLLFIMCLVCAIIGGIYLGRTDTSRYWYERNSLYASSTVANAVIIFL